MTNFFDDPDVRAQLARSGVVHKPGLADQMLRELAPLLAAEDIHVDDLDGIDINTFNAALARATERHNLALFTPAGAHHEQALSVLRVVSEAIADGDDGAARAVLTQIQPDPGNDTPSVAHVIGVSLGVLDHWHTDPAQRTALAATRVPSWDKFARSAATDILALARKGRAFEALDSLHRRHTGLAILHGSALVVAASLASRAAHENIFVRQLGERLLADGRAAVALRGLERSEDGMSGRRKGKPSGHPARRGAPLTDRAAAREFRRWLDLGPAHDAPGVAEKVHLLETLLATARAAGLNLNDPDDIDGIIDVILDIEDPREADDAFDTLHDYIHFRIDTADRSEAWEGAHEIVEEMLEERPEGVDALAHAIESTEQLDPEERREALGQTRLVSAVHDLLTWVGNGRQVSPSGGVRRTDIQHVAGMLGVSAMGVNKRPGFEPERTPLFALDASRPEPSVIHALSMHDVPMLAAWWETLVSAKVIETTATRVRPGATAAAWAAEPVPHHESAEMVVGLFVAEVLTHGLDRGLAPFEEGVASEAIRLLLRALAPETVEDDGDAEHGGLEYLLRPRVLSMLRQLELAGLLRFDGDEPAVVPVALRKAVARGVILAMAYLVGGLEER